MKELIERLSDEEIDELDAVRDFTSTLQRATFIHKCNWRPLYQGLVQRGLVTWKPHPEFGPDFRSVELTDKGRAALTARQEMEAQSDA